MERINSIRPSTKRKSADLLEAFIFYLLILAVVLVVRGQLDRPQVTLEGLVGGLRIEGGLVGDQSRRVLGASRYGCRDSLEAQLTSQFGLRHRRRASYGTQTTQVEVRTLIVLRRSDTVGSQYHLLVSCVRRLLVDFYEGTANGLDSVSPFYFCHSRSAIGRVRHRIRNGRYRYAKSTGESGLRFPHRSKATLGAPLSPTRQAVQGILYAE